MMMETIQLRVPSELAKRLRPHYDELPKILEWGLRCMEGELDLDALSSDGKPASPPERERLLEALRSTGILVDLDPAIAVKYQAGADQQQHTPVQVDGTPLSEMIVAERRQRWNEDR
jgi:hypothetical protein